jgi:ribosomal protein S27AE
VNDFVQSDKAGGVDDGEAERSTSDPVDGELPMGNLQEEMIEHLKKKWPGKSCPMCGGEKWIVGDDMYAVCMFANGALQLGGKMFPMVSVVCGNCGFTVWINGIVSGLFKPPADTGENKTNEQ